MVLLRCASVTWQSVVTSSFGHEVDEMGIILKFMLNISKGKGHAVAQLDEALRCKPEVRGFDS
jgi:hypothetical protein